MKIYPQQKLNTEEMNTCFVKIVEDEGMQTHKTNVYIRQLVLLMLAFGQMFYNLAAIGRSDIKCQNVKEAFIVSYLIPTRTNSHWCISQILVSYWLVSKSKPLCLRTCACLVRQGETSLNANIDLVRIFNCDCRWYCTIDYVIINYIGIHHLFHHIQ